MVVILLLWICGISYVGASHFVLTAPNVLRFNHEETVLVTAIDETNFIVQIWLQIDGRNLPSQTVIVRDEAHPTTTTVFVTEDDLFKKDGDKQRANQKRLEKPGFVTLYAQTKFGTFSRRIPISYETGYILIQTSKPLYHPTEKVEVRALAMTESLKFAKEWNITMDMISPSGLTFRRIEKRDHQRFFQVSFILPPKGELGLWTIKAYYEGYYETQATHKFNVEEYVLPTFGVKVTVDKKVILDEPTWVTITVTAKYVYNKPVKGKAVLKISCKDDDFNIKSLEKQPQITLNADGQGEYKLDVKELVNAAGGFPDGQQLHVTARVIERASLNDETGFYTGTVFSRDRYIFNIDRSKKSYHPGMSYDLWATVSLANGDDPGKRQVTVTREGGPPLSKTSDAQGSALLSFVPPAEAKDSFMFQISVDGESPKSFTIYAYKGKEQIQVDHYEKDAKLMLAVLTNIQGGRQTYSGITCLMLSRGRHIHHEYLPPAINPEKAIYKETQEKLAPEGRLVAFYINKQTGKLVADSSKVSVMPKCHGRGLELLPAKVLVRPYGTNTLNVEGVPKMSVGLNVMDKALLLLDSKHVLRESKIFDMMKAHDLGCGQGGGATAEQVFRDAGLTIITNANIDNTVFEEDPRSCTVHSRNKRSISKDYKKTYNSQCSQDGEMYADIFIMTFPENLGELQRRAVEICETRTTNMSKLRTDTGENRYSISCLEHHYQKCVQTIQVFVQKNWKKVKSPLNISSEYMEALSRIKILYNEVVEREGKLEKDVFPPFSNTAGWMIQSLVKSALDTSSEYVEALSRYRIRHNEIVVWSDFRDSWLFEMVELDEEGKLEKDISFPSSMTDWMIQGIGISDETGPCIANPVNITAFKNFFIQLDLPYKASRLEYFEITATLFNYDDRETIKGEIFIEGVKGLCTGVDPDKTNEVAKFELGPNDAQTVRIPILPLEARKFPIRVTALGRINGVSKYDAIENKLLVVNEGIEEREVIVLCLDPLNTDGDKSQCIKNDRVMSNEFVEDVQHSVINLTLSDKAIPGTGSAYAYLSSNVMEDTVRTISGIDNMLRQPRGNGEQTMLFLGPSVYVKTYWEQTNQMNPEREKKSNEWIVAGITREMIFRKADGSYGAWFHRTSSTWLTAFVAKVFCQAEKVVDNVIIKAQHVVPTIKWLETKVKANTGQFYDPLPVIHREMIGQIKENDPSLTAFVLISLSECKLRTANTDRVKQGAIRFLEGLSDATYINNKYLLAITTYALALAESSNARRYLDLLLKNDNTAGIDRYDKKVIEWNKKGRYWGNPGGRPANANSVETTSYALLAMLEFHRDEEADGVVKWLTDQRSADGAFRTTQDTIVGLQALSKYTAATFTRDVDLELKLTADNWGERSEVLDEENTDLQKTINDLPVSHEPTRLNIKTEGKGTGRLVIDYRYNREATEKEKCSFDIEGDIIIKRLDPIDVINGGVNFNRVCDVCGICEGDDKTDNDYKIFEDADLNDAPEVRPHIGKRAADDDVSNMPTFCIKFRVKSLRGRRHGMSIIDVGLETYMVVEKMDLDRLKENGVIDSYELPEQDKGFFILYLDKISSEPTDITFRLKQKFNGDISTRQPAAIKIYDYYHPEYECTRFYGTGPRKGAPVRFQCEAGGQTRREACTCLQDVCPHPDEGAAIVQMARDKKKPAVSLVGLTCDNKRANFAAIVKVNSRSVDIYNGKRIVEAEVIRNLHKGKDDLFTGRKIKLKMPIFCQINITSNQEYYLITKDGFGSYPIEYQPSGTSVIVEYHERLNTLPGEKKLLQRIMRVFEILIEKGCKH